MFFKDRIDRMTRRDLEEEIRTYKDFSKYNRKELEKELKELLPEINLDEFSDQQLEDLLRANYSFSDYTTQELREELRRHSRFQEWSREELEEEYEQLEEPNVEKHKNIRWILIVVLCSIMAYYFGAMNTQLNYQEQRIQELQQELNILEQENEVVEDKVDTLSDVIDMIIDYITTDVPAMENPTEII